MAKEWPTMSDAEYDEFLHSQDGYGTDNAEEIEAERRRAVYNHVIAPLIELAFKHGSEKLLSNIEAVTDLSLISLDGPSGDAASSTVHTSLGDVAEATRATLIMGDADDSDEESVSVFEFEGDEDGLHQIGFEDDLVSISRDTDLESIGDFYAESPENASALEDAVFADASLWVSLFMKEFIVSGSEVLDDSGFSRHHPTIGHIMAQGRHAIICESVFEMYRQYLEQLKETESDTPEERKNMAERFTSSASIQIDLD